MTSNVSIDTNILIYAFDSSPDSRSRSETARKIIAERPSVSVQVLNEFVRAARRKLKFNSDRLVESLNLIHAFCQPVFPVTFELHRQGVEISLRYGFEIFDSTIVASAVEAGCTTFLTEDMQHGQIIEGLRIVNPFLEAGN